MGHTILIVEDEDIIRKGLTKIIGRMGLPIGAVLEAGDGAAALQAFESEKPCIVLTDIKMPGMSGLDVIREIRNRDQNVKIIILSGYGEFEYARTAIRFGVTDYLLKPIKKNILRDVLLKVLDSIEDRERKLSVDGRDLHGVDLAASSLPELQGEASTNLGVIGLALSYMSERYTNGPSLEEVARHVCLNANYFSSLFRRKTGVKFSRYLQHLKVAKAKELLSDPRNRIYRISACVGFNDEKYFCRVFKKITGQTPNQYRGSHPSISEG